MAEHLTRNEDVRGSIPRGGSNEIKDSDNLSFFIFPEGLEIASIFFKRGQILPLCPHLIKRYS